MANMTRPNKGGTYRIPMTVVGEFRFLSHGDTQAIFGDVADRLGRYEKLGEPEELERILATIKK